MTVELLGDRWSLVVLRGLLFSGHRHSRELLTNSIEGIASNILTARLSKLVGCRSVRGSSPKAVLRWGEIHGGRPILEPPEFAVGG